MMIQLQTFKEEFNELPVTRGSLSNKDKTFDFKQGQKNIPQGRFNKALC